MAHLFDNQCLIIKEEQTIPHTVHCFWKGFWSDMDEDLLSALNVALEYAKTNQTKVVLSDGSELQTVALEVQDYIQH